MFSFLLSVLQNCLIPRILTRRTIFHSVDSLLLNLPWTFVQILRNFQIMKGRLIFYHSWGQGVQYTLFPSSLATPISTKDKLELIMSTNGQTTNVCFIWLIIYITIFLARKIAIKAGLAHFNDSFYVKKSYKISTCWMLEMLRFFFTFTWN